MTACYYFKNCNKKRKDNMKSYFKDLESLLAVKKFTFSNFHAAAVFWKSWLYVVLRNILKMNFKISFRKVLLFFK